ncbi:hypothetical protein OCGS_0508 [Oceaniovalibus guishaninsula JLT2003]|uniref:TadE-like domain-containing protein n=1 Tax=Oceaniovalibus guishaninsula JLT2003 TaxID=1231392 RepID=K2HD81_9RHOB|nr:TadE/TadG family type IV pilus assembly protein [Oceaniovalibus guishaninsula]EKE45418.1 hypothetical protein OCGS_0508 [Oceaniovalibus guishaninsula JLT2003]
MSFRPVDHQAPRRPGPVRRFLRDRDGSATVEFVILFPVFMTLMLVAIESGVTMTRQMLLEHGVDRAVREIRLNMVPAPTVAELKKSICRNVSVMSNCMADVKVEMVRVDPRDWRPLPTTPDCVDRGDPDRGDRTVVFGKSNQLMLLRVCALFDPILPGSLLGQKLVTSQGAGFAVVTLSAFVLEPTET